MSTTPPALAADLETGLRRLKLAAMRRLTPELLVTAKTQPRIGDDYASSRVSRPVRRDLARRVVRGVIRGARPGCAAVAQVRLDCWLHR